MNITSLKTILLSFALLNFISSCSNDSSDLITDQTLAQCLTYTKDAETQAQNFNKISFSAQFNYTTNTVDLSISGLTLPVAGNSDGVTYPKMTFKNLPWYLNIQGWKVVDVSSVYPEINGYAEFPEFNKLKFELVDLFDTNNNYHPGINYQFTINDSYESNGCCMTGTTVSTAPDGSTFSPESDAATTVKPAYWIDFDYKNSLADIYLYGAKFLQGMPSLNLVFPKVPFTTMQGAANLVCDELTPEYNGIPNPGVPVSNLNGTLNFTSGLKLNFNCNFRGTDYKVEIDAKY